MVSPFHVWSSQYLQMQDNFPSHLCRSLPKVLIWRHCAHRMGRKHWQQVLEMKKLDSSILVIIGHRWNLDPLRLILTHFRCLLGQICVVCENYTFQEVQPLNWLCGIRSYPFSIRQLSAKFIQLEYVSCTEREKLGSTKR